MANGKGAPRDPAELRLIAEERLKQRGAKAALRGDAEALRLLHELEVHQIELEMQNEELRASRFAAEEMASRFSELHDFAPVGYATLGSDGTIRAVNFAAASVIGVERSRLNGKRFQLFVSGPNRSMFSEFLTRTVLRRGEAKETCDLALELPERGDVVHVHLTATTLSRPDPEILLAIQDVTDLRKREEELHEALRLLDLSQRIAGLGTFTIDVATGHWMCSASVDEILGIATRRITRTTSGFLELVVPEDRDTLTRYLLAEMKRGEPLDQEFRVVVPGGEVRWVWARGGLEYHALEPFRLVGTIQDITERKRLQEERAELLRGTQAARTDAEEANRSKDAFMAVLSHELRNPLTPITNGLFILERAEPGSEQARRAITIIGRQVHHLERLVDDLLDTTRIARGKVQLRRTRIDLNDLARSMVEDHHAQFDGSGVRLELAPAPAPVVVDGDWHRLAQVVGNLLQNAAKFCMRGGVTRISVSKDAREMQALVHVADDGVGMAPEVLSRLFQPFMQADTTLERSKGGLGLGMALAKRLVELHGGEISAHSDGLGKGAEFAVRLPLASGTAATTAHESRAGQAIPRAASARRRVLIIEDNVDGADTLREVLELHSHEVGVAHSGPEGLAMARAFRPEIVLCDIGLPGMDGYEVARAIRADGALDGVYVVALSGYALSDDVERAVESGFHTHLAKPPSIEDLERVLAEAPRAPRSTAR